MFPVFRGGLRRRIYIVRSTNLDNKGRMNHALQESFGQDFFLHCSSTGETHGREVEFFSKYLPPPFKFPSRSSQSLQCKESTTEPAGSGFNSGKIAYKRTYCKKIGEIILHQECANWSSNWQSRERAVQHVSRSLLSPNLLDECNEKDSPCYVRGGRGGLPDTLVVN